MLLRVVNSIGSMFGCPSQPHGSWVWILCSVIGFYVQELLQLSFKGARSINHTTGLVAPNFWESIFLIIAVISSYLFCTCRCESVIIRTLPIYLSYVLVPSIFIAMCSTLSWIQVKFLSSWKHKLEAWEASQFFWWNCAGLYSGEDWPKTFQLSRWFQILKFSFWCIRPFSLQLSWLLNFRKRFNHF